MSLARSIAHNTAIHLIGRMLSVAMALAVIAIMTRALGPDGFGGYSIIINFLQFFGITVDFGLTLTANRMLGASSSKEETEKIMSNLMTIRILSAVLFLIIAPCVALLFPYSTEVKQGMFLTSLSFLAIILGQTLVPVFQKELKMLYPALAEITGRVVLLTGVALAAYFHTGLLWFMAAIVFGSVAQYLFLRTAVKRFVQFKFWAFDLAVWKKIIITSWPIGVSIIFNLVYLKADAIILSITHPASEVGFYSAAYRVIDQFTAVATMFIGLVLPPMTAAWVAHDKEKFKRIYQGAFDAYALIAFPLAAGALALGVPLMKLLASSEFAISGVILGILMLGMIAVFFSTLFGHIVVVINKQKPMILGYAINAALGLLLYFYAIPRYGMFGAAWATVVTEVLIMIITYLVVTRTVKITPHFQLIFKSILASLVMAVVVFLARGAHIVALIALGIITYFLALFALRGIKKETLRELLSLKSP